MNIISFFFSKGIKMRQRHQLMSNWMHINVKEIVKLLVVSKLGRVAYLISWSRWRPRSRCWQKDWTLNSESIQFIYAFVNSSTSLQIVQLAVGWDNLGVNSILGNAPDSECMILRSQHLTPLNNKLMSFCSESSSLAHLNSA